jgi:hypothetical protein
MSLGRTELGFTSFGLTGIGLFTSSCFIARQRKKYFCQKKTMTEIIMNGAQQQFCK